MTRGSTVVRMPLDKADSFLRDSTWSLYTHSCTTRNARPFVLCLSPSRDTEDTLIRLGLKRVMGMHVRQCDSSIRCSVIILQDYDAIMNKKICYLQVFCLFFLWGYRDVT